MSGNGDPNRRLRRALVAAAASAAVAGKTRIVVAQGLSRLAILSSNTPEIAGPNVARFRQRLTELGYIEGRNIETRVSWAEGDLSRLPRLATELLQWRPDVIVAPNTPELLALKQTGTTVPVVMLLTTDAVNLGLANSLASPGGNFTGLIMSAGRQLSGKRIELLKEIAPKVSMLGILQFAQTGDPVDDALAAAAEKQFSVDVVTVNDATGVAAALDGMVARGVGGLYVIPSVKAFMSRRSIVDNCLRHKLPGCAGNREFCTDGLLVTIGHDLARQYQRGADYVHRILAGAKPASLPIEQPTILETSINLRTAKILGIAVPRSQDQACSRAAKIALDKRTREIGLATWA